MDESGEKKKIFYATYYHHAGLDKCENTSVPTYPLGRLTPVSPTIAKLGIRSLSRKNIY